MHGERVKFDHRYCLFFVENAGSRFLPEGVKLQKDNILPLYKLLCCGNLYCMISGLFSWRSGSGWNHGSILILNASCRQTCITCASAEFTVDNSWGWAEKLPETCRVSYQKNFGNQCICWFLL